VRSHHLLDAAGIRQQSDGPLFRTLSTASPGQSEHPQTSQMNTDKERRLRPMERGEWVCGHLCHLWIENGSTLEQVQQPFATSVGGLWRAGESFGGAGCIIDHAVLSFQGNHPRAR